MRKSKFYWLLAPLLWSMIVVLARLLPHPPNATPLISLCLMAGLYWTRIRAIIFTMAAILFSDVVLSLVYHFSWYGNWQWFNYSAYLVMVLLAPLLLRQRSSLWRWLVIVLMSGLGFWLWTNLGVWLLNDWYPKSTTGLLACYTAALPFLRNAILGDLIWGIVCYGLQYGLFVANKKTYQLNIQ